MTVLAPMWILMALWLVLVAVSVLCALRKWKRTHDFLKKQMFYLWFGSSLVFVGDLLHTIAFTVSTYTNNPTGPITVGGSVFEFRTFAMFFDALIFIVYYTLWALFIIARYQQGKRLLYDNVTLGLAIFAMVLILPGAVPNALGVYTLDYILAIWAPHILLFILFGSMTVLKLIRCSRHAYRGAVDPLVQTQEKSLSITGIGFAFSFLFFTLFLLQATLSSPSGPFMVFKTFAYMIAFYYLIKGFILSTPES